MKKILDFWWILPIVTYLLLFAAWFKTSANLAIHQAVCEARHVDVLWLELSQKTNTVTLTNYVTVTNVVHEWRGSGIIVTNAPLWPANATGVWMRTTSTNWKCPHHNNPWHEVTENCPDYEK